MKDVDQLSLFRFLGQHVNCRKLKTARTLVSCFVSVSQSSVVSRSMQSSWKQGSLLPLKAADLYSVPSRVRAHYVKLLLDWVVPALTRAKNDRSADDDASSFLQQLHHKWKLLFVLLTSTDSSAQSAPNITLIAAAAAACKECSTREGSGTHGCKLALALQQTLLALNTKYRRSFRPSLEHR